jgi:hypothetical protein
MNGMDWVDWFQLVYTGGWILFFAWEFKKYIGSENAKIEAIKNKHKRRD